MNGNAPRNTPAIDPARCILAGSRGKLNVMGKCLSVEVLDVGKHMIRVSFPVGDWPAEGTPVELDLPFEHEFVHYRAVVANEPETAYFAGLVLSDPILCEPELALRRHSRVPTDLTVQVKESPHPRRFDALVVNLSIGGALLRSKLAAEPGHKLAIDLSLPCHCVERIRARIVYAAPEAEFDGGRLLGVCFVNQKSETASAISDYVDQRLQAT